MHRRNAVRALLPVGVLGLALCAPCAFAQAYPAKPVRVVVGFSAGGPQVLHRDMLRKISHPVRGMGPSIGPAVKYSEFDVAGDWSAPPALGEHSTSAINDWLNAA